MNYILKWFANMLSAKEGFEKCYKLNNCHIGEDKRLWKCTSVEFTGTACKGYRLPLEEEWEYAARAGAETELYTGGRTLFADCYIPELDPIAWYCGNSGVDYEEAENCSSPWYARQYKFKKCGPHPVGKKMPNKWGLYDMIGNVQEWVYDKAECPPYNMRISS